MTRNSRSFRSIISINILIDFHKLKHTTMNHLFIRTSLIIVLFLTHLSKSEFFTAISEMEKLLHTEGEIVKTLDKYLKFEEERLEKIKWLSKQYRNLYNDAYEDVDAFLFNPVNAYLLVKRLTADWETASFLIEGYDSKAVIHNVTSHIRNFPNKEDLSGAAAALLRLQDIYLLDTSTIASGQIKGTNSSTELTAGDCFVLGQQASNAGDYKHSDLWMQESLNRLEKEDTKTANKVEILEYRAYAQYHFKNYSEAVRFTREILNFDPDNPRALGNLIFYQTQAEELATKQEEKLDDVKYPPEVINPETATVYERLCRGESIKTPVEESKLHCYYTNNGNYYLLMQPVKVEVLNLKPRIAMFHDVIKNREINVIKSLATPKLTRALVSNTDSGRSEAANFRVSKSTWLDDYENHTLPHISQRIEDITGLDIKISEPLHVINYGIGGHYEPHFDFALDGHGIDYMQSMGNRIATWIFYLSDVPAGGSTVFPTIGVEVKPVKGSAAFWYNLHRNGDGDTNTMHAACPVLAGSKWVANKWFHEFGNTFRRPCTLDPLE